MFTHTYILEHAYRTWLQAPGSEERHADMACIQYSNTTSRSWASCMQEPWHSELMCMCVCVGGGGGGQAEQEFEDDQGEPEPDDNQAGGAATAAPAAGAAAAAGGAAAAGVADKERDQLAAALERLAEVSLVFVVLPLQRYSTLRHTTHAMTCQGQPSGRWAQL